MKKLLIALLSLSSLSAFAQSSLDAQGIYESLNAQEQDVSVGEGASKFQKAVGGLTCTKSQVVYPGAQPQYSCAFDTKYLDAEQIYEALNIDAKDVSVGEGVSKFEKSLAGMKCTLSQVIYPGAKAKYACSLSMSF